MNSPKTVFIVIATLSVSVALGEHFTTTGGKECKDATVRHVEADGIVVKSKSKICEVYFAELPPDVQQRFHYDPKTQLPLRQLRWPQLNRQINK